MLRDRAITTRRLALKRTLLDGATFTKFGRAGFPHARTVWLTDDGAAIRWRKPGSRVTPLKGGEIVGARECLPVAEIRDVLEGPDTSSVLVRNAKAIRVPAHCFTLVCASRTLDLEAPTFAAKEEWVTALLALKRFRGAL